MFPTSGKKIKLTLEISFEQRLLGNTKNVTIKIRKKVLTRQIHLYLIPLSWFLYNKTCLD